MLWPHDGSKIFFLDEDEHLLAVTVTTEPELTLSEPEKVLDAGELRMADERMIPLPDGERFVFIQKGEEEKEKEHLNVVLNWFEVLKKKVPTQVTQADRPGM